MLGRHLGKKKSSFSIFGNHEAMFACCDDIGINDLSQGGKHGYLYFQIIKFIACNREETGVTTGRINASLHHGLVKRQDRFDEADASPQFSLLFEGYESSAFL